MARLNLSRFVLICSALGGLTVLWILATQLGQRSGGISVSPLRMQLGSVLAGVEVSNLFVLRNDSTRTIMLRDVDADCDCTAVMTTRAVLPPASQLAIPIVFRTAGRPRADEHWISFHTDAGTITAKAELDVRPALRSLPNELKIRMEGIVGNVHLTNALISLDPSLLPGGQPELTASVSNPSLLACSIRPGPEANQYLLDVRAEPKGPLDAQGLRENIRVTERRSGVDLIVYVELVFDGSMRFDPAGINFGLYRRSEPKTATVRITPTRPEREIRPRISEMPMDGILRARLHPTSATQWTLEAELVPNRSGPVPEGSFIEIRDDASPGPIWRLPVFGQEENEASCCENNKDQPPRGADGGPLVSSTGGTLSPCRYRAGG